MSSLLLQSQTEGETEVCSATPRFCFSDVRGMWCQEGNEDHSTTFGAVRVQQNGVLCLFWLHLPASLPVPAHPIWVYMVKGSHSDAICVNRERTQSIFEQEAVETK